MGHRFTAILEAEWQGILGRIWKSERPLFFAYVTITKTLGVRRAKEIQVQITRRMELWERGIHAILVGDTKAELASGKGRPVSGGELEEEEVVAPSYHDTVLSGKLQQAICQATDTEGGRCLLPDDLCKKTGRPGAEVIREKHTDMRVPPVKIPRAKPLSSMGRCPKLYPSTSRRMT